MFIFLCNKLNFIVFSFSLEKKISQILDILARFIRAKWTCYSGHMAKEKGEHNS